MTGCSTQDWGTALCRLATFPAAATDYAVARSFLPESSSKLSRWFQSRVDKAVKKSHWRKALSYFDLLIEQSDEAENDWRLYADRAMVLKELGMQEARALDITRVLAKCDSSSQVLSYVDEFARQDDWQRVVELFGKASDLGAISLADWHRYSLALLHADDDDAYRDNCALLVENLLQRELSPNSTAALAWLCAIGPSNSNDAAKVIPLIEASLATLPLERSRQRYALLNTLGALHQRSGSPDKSIERLNEGLTIVDGKGDLTDWVVLAMAHHQLGQDNLVPRQL